MRHRFTPLVIALGLLPACGEEPGTGNTAPRVPVTAVPVVEDAVNRQVEVVGRIRAVTSVEVPARVSGVLEAVVFAFGSELEFDEILFELDKEPFQIAVNAAEATMMSADAAHQQATQYLERLRSVREGGVAPNELENARLEEARMLALLDQAKAQHEAAKLDLAFATIKAPIAGRVGRTSLAKGDFVSPQAGTLVTIHQVDPIEVSFFVPEAVFVASELARQAEGRSMEEDNESVSLQLRLADGTIYDEEGRISFVDNEVNTRTGTVTIRASFANKDGILLPGQFATVVVTLGETEKKPVVPRIAILEDRSGSNVLVVRSDGTSERRAVELGPSVGRRVSVLSGVTTGELVVTEGLDKIRPGALLDVKRVDSSNGN